MDKNYDEIISHIDSMKDNTFDSRVSFFIKEIRALSLPKTIKATRLVIEEMSEKKGFVRHDGRDYFVHPIAVAQTALDFDLMKNNDAKTADIILATCLLHDILEDVKTITPEMIREQFGLEVMINVDNVSKREGEDFIDYIDRFSSRKESALVKIIDRLNNVATLSNSTLEHRKRQLEETRKVYLPLTKVFRRTYWEDGNFYYQARFFMTSLLSEIERGIIAEEALLELQKQNKELRLDEKNK